MATDNHTYHLPIGGIYVTSDETTISTVLGSCISVCLYDRLNKVGGMNHYMLPQAPGTSRETKEIGRYGDLSIPELLNQFRRQGGNVAMATAKIFGGAHMLSALTFANIPEKNIETAVRQLEQASVKIAHREVGGERGRKIQFETGSGKILVRIVAHRSFSD